MSIHMNLDYHEPPNGDFVRLIESLVGLPPEDPEATAKMISTQLLARTKRNRELVEAVGTRNHADTIARPMSPIGGPPDLNDAIGSLGSAGANAIKGGIKLLATLAIAAGVALLAAPVLLADLLPLPTLPPTFGVGMIFVGIVIRNAMS